MKRKIKLCMVGAGVLFTLGLGLYNFSNTQAEEPREEIVYTVKSGDTLWGIVKKYELDGDNEDIREVIYRVSERNHLGNEPLEVGKQIILYKRK